MSRRAVRATRSAVACTLAGVLALTGCGFTDHDSADAPDSTTTVGGELDPWLDEVCGAVDSIATVANERRELDWADVSDPDTAAELVAHLELVETEIGQARAVLDSAGAPPVEDGDAVLAEMQESFEERQDAVTDAIEFIEDSASRVGPLAAAQIASAAQTAYTAAPRLARAIERHDELQNAYETTPTCNGL
ncbi:hypothetical protein [Brachybacterium sacelli]|uniref:DUF305 domain-containing protein n=1 Tax=Brachybacterium sacelli TaxID=173364 RepID=A0ABS4X6C5_9MICO|nr:hypothetical protein [Brachybacterium sacelli]MBP2384004.1 hypothetical protein [Brachybacterium sacelli]